MCYCYTKTKNLKHLFMLVEVLWFQCLCPPIIHVETVSNATESRGVAIRKQLNYQGSSCDWDWGPHKKHTSVRLFLPSCHVVIQHLFPPRNAATRCHFGGRMTGPHHTQNLSELKPLDFPRNEMKMKWKKLCFYLCVTQFMILCYSSTNALRQGTFTAVR